MPKTKQTPFDIKESALNGPCDSYEKLARWLCEALQDAIDVRGPVDLELDYFWRLYEQQRTRLASHMPWPDAADLTSPLGTQYVDSFHARAMQTMFGVDKVWTVEGWGESVAKAPFVEAFHQWTFEDERGPSMCDLAIFNSWVDGVGILEVSEAIDYRPVMSKGLWYQLEVDKMTGAAIFGPDNNPLFAKKAGKFIEVPQHSPASAQADVDTYEPVRIGPEYDVIDFRDFYVLPRHARSRKDVWGYGKRFYRTVQYLQEKVADGIYDQAFVESIHDDNERETDLEDARKDIAVARQEGPLAQKELFEIAFLKNLDGKGLRWWVATVHLREQKLARLKYDDLGQALGFGRYVRYIPFPRKNQIDRGMSLIEKILTSIEEHTAVRNMRADGCARDVAVPLKRLHTALWRPEEQAWGPKAVIDVRTMDEVQFMDVPPSATSALNDWEQTVLDGTERTIGMTDIASGVEPNESRTLGERRMTTGFSQVRVDLPIKRLQEANEDLWQIRHTIWKRTLAQQGEGVDIPQRAMYGLEQRGVDIQPIEGGKFTADLLDGKFRGKPFGSVETADPMRQRGDYNELLAVLPALMQTNPMIAQMLMTPEAGRALLERALDVHGVKDKQPFLGMAGQSAMGTAGLIADPTIQAALQPQPPGMPPMGGATMAPGAQPMEAAAPPMLPPMPMAGGIQ